MRVSVKQLSTFGVVLKTFPGGCPRKWGLQYLDKLKSEWLAPALVDGIKFHSVCASLVATGRMPEAGVLQPGVVLSHDDVLPESRLGRLARAALICLPVREYGTWAVEHVGSFPYVTSKGVHCTIDLRPDLTSEPLGAPQLGYLIDFKSTSNKRYALKSLADDAQANVYSAGLMHMGAMSVLARWIYVDKNSYASWFVEHVFHREVVAAWMEKNVDPTIELINTFRESGLSGMDLPADLEACGGVGRFCDHAERCLVGPVGPLPSLIGLSEIVRYKEGI